ncbi:MAG: TlpA family protein disulfide reductase [Mucilaginibacter sp.]
MEKPVFAYVDISSGDDNNSKEIHYYLYLSPGDKLDLLADLLSRKTVIRGKGSNNNQPMLSMIEAEGVRSFYGDSLPDRTIIAANKYQADLKSVFPKYIKKYKPSADFVNVESENIKYAAVGTYYDFKESNKFSNWRAYQKYGSIWTKIQDSLFSRVTLNNSNALTAFNYAKLVSNFLLREKERLWDAARKDPANFYREYYNTDTAAGKKLFDADMQNLLTQKILEKHFTGPVQEYAYGISISQGLGSHSPENMVSIFDEFKNRFPDSKYVKWFGPAIDTIRQQETQPLSNEMVFAPGNGSMLHTFADVLAMAKGKTVLLDMWGTWCGPCRNEISNNGPAIKAYFKNKGLDYFYVANNDMGHDDAWKKLIAYLNMTGTHILANPALSKDIMRTVKGSGYPTYVIIKKDGTWELSKAGYPMKRDVLFKQLDAALTMK